MIGRTNAQSFGAGGAVDGVTVADLPTCPQAVSAASNSGKVIISLTYSDTDFVSGVDVVYKTGSYPTSPADGDVVSVDGAETSIDISGLTNGTKYFFRVYLFRKIGGVKYFQTDDTNAKVFATPSAVGIDGITPAIVADNYLVIDQSGSFTLSIPEGLTVTAYLVSGGGAGSKGWDGYDDDDPSGGYNGGDGGYGGKTLLQQISLTGSVPCISAIGSANSSTTTKCIISGTTYTASGYGLSGGKSGDSNYGRDGLSTPYGFIGSSGGGGGSGSYSNATYGKGGAGAGDGGAGAENRKEASNGKDAVNYGCGGGGGGGGYDDHWCGSGGNGKQGAIIIGWE